MKQKPYIIIFLVLLISLFSVAIALTQEEDPNPGGEAPISQPSDSGDAESSVIGAPSEQNGYGIDSAANPELVQANVENAFTYQGQLSENGSPAAGDYEFTFKLYDDAAAGIQVGGTITQVLTVENGLFTASLDFGNVFDGTGFYLEIGVRPDGSVDPLIILAPRQALTAAPYALTLRPGANVSGQVSGDAVIQAHNTATSGASYGLIGETDTSGFAASAILGRINSTSPGSLSAGVRGINSGTGSLGIGVWGHQNGSGWGLYGSSVTGYGAYIASTADGGRGVYARGGSGADADIILGGNDSSAIGDDGRIISDPGYTGSDIYLASNDAVVVQLDNDASGEDADFFVEDMSGNIIFNVDESAELSLFAPGGAEYLQINNDTVEGGGEIHLRNAAGATAMWVEASEGGTDGAQLALYDSTGAATIILDAEFGAGGDGRITTEVLQITGGSDLSEQFEVQAGTANSQPEAGYVVSIDAENPGQLLVSHKAYDRTVAGVISGAGDVKTGMLMGQTGTAADGRYPVALTGRVYVWVDAAYGAIQPGDLLTTSDTPGHAMLASDHAQAQGAILGKAMTPLSDGRGLVLVLVSLQ